MVLPGRLVHEIRTLPALTALEAVLIRTDDDVGDSFKVNVMQALYKANPDWRGLILFLRTDQDIGHLSEPALRELYAKLHEMFGPKELSKVDEPA